MYPNTKALAKRLNKPIVVFDIEHTGGKTFERFITEFGAMVVTSEGAVSSFSSLVKPPSSGKFNPLVSRLTGIYPSTVRNAPDWAHVLSSFVRPHMTSLWVGFNSRAVDTPLVNQECSRYAAEVAIKRQFDLMRVGALRGSLSQRLLQLVPDFDVSGSHRGLKDALMTLTLLEAQLPSIADRDVLNQDFLTSKRNSKVKPESTPEPATIAPKCLEVSDNFLVAPGVSRAGARWGDAEYSWLATQFQSARHLWRN